MERGVEHGSSTPPGRGGAPPVGSWSGDQAPPGRCPPPPRTALAACGSGFFPTVINLSESRQVLPGQFRIAICGLPASLRAAGRVRYPAISRYRGLCNPVFRPRTLPLTASNGVAAVPHPVGTPVDADRPGRRLDRADGPTWRPPHLSTPWRNRPPGSSTHLAETSLEGRPPYLASFVDGISRQMCRTHRRRKFAICVTAARERDAKCGGLQAGLLDRLAG